MDHSKQEQVEELAVVAAAEAMPEHTDYSVGWTRLTHPYSDLSEEMKEEVVMLPVVHQRDH